MSLLLVILILATGGFFRLYHLATVPPGLFQDEAKTANDALESLSTGHFKIYYSEHNGVEQDGIWTALVAASLRIFGNVTWAIRLVPALVGSVTILGVYLLAKELFLDEDNSEKSPPVESRPGHSVHVSNSASIGLLAAVFLATSYWHVHLSRVTLQAILVPLFSSFGMYFLLRGLRTSSRKWLVFAGITVGLGFSSYTPFRFMPLILALPIGWYLFDPWRRSRRRATSLNVRGAGVTSLVLTFLAVTFIAALPMLIYFLANPHDVLSRGSQVSIFAAESPPQQFFKTNLQTLAMFFGHGDCNWRQNYDCKAELHPITAVFFVTGAILAIAAPARKSPPLVFRSLILLLWFAVMTLPATLTQEGIPHALRSVGLIPPVMIMAGCGAWSLGQLSKRGVDHFVDGRPQQSIARYLPAVVPAVGSLLLLAVALSTYHTYFTLFPARSEAYYAFQTNLLHAGEYLNGLPSSTQKYVVVDFPGEHLVRGIPMPAQPVMFASDSATDEKQIEKNIFYLQPAQLRLLTLNPNQKAVFLFLNVYDTQLINDFQSRFPALKSISQTHFIEFRTP